MTIEMWMPLQLDLVERHMRRSSDAAAPPFRRPPTSTRPPTTSLWSRRLRREGAEIEVLTTRSPSRASDRDEGGDGEGLPSPRAARARACAAPIEADTAHLGDVDKGVLKVRALKVDGKTVQGQRQVLNGFGGAEPCRSPPHENVHDKEEER